MNKIVEIKNLYKEYYRGRSVTEILKGVDLVLDSGEVICILGASGSGKSTLLHILGLVDNFDHGILEILGHKFSSSAKEGCKTNFRLNNIGFIYQNHYMLEDFNIIENVSIPLLLKGESKARAFTIADKLIEQVGLSGRIYNFPGDLSGGELQRVAIIRALIANPRLLLADEPTGNLDNDNSIAVFNLILKYIDGSNKGAIIVTHNEDLARLCSKAYKIKDYKIKRLW